MNPVPIDPQAARLLLRQHCLTREGVARVLVALIDRLEKHGPATLLQAERHLWAALGDGSAADASFDALLGTALQFAFKRRWLEPRPPHLLVTDAGYSEVLCEVPRDSYSEPMEVSSLARKFGVSKPTMSKRLRNGEIDARPFGRRWRVLLADMPAHSFLKIDKK